MMPKMTGPFSEGLETDEDHALARSWFRTRNETTADKGGLANSLSWYRKHERIFLYVIHNDEEAMKIALRRKWYVPAPDPSLGWDDPAKIRNSIRLVMEQEKGMQKVLGKFLGAAVAKFAPQHLGHVPPQWHPTEEEAA